MKVAKVGNSDRRAVGIADRLDQRIDGQRLQAHAGSAGGHCLAAILIFLLAWTGCATHEPSPLLRFEFERPQMGLPFRLVFYAPNATAATNAAESTWTRIAELNAIMSDYEADSELSRLSRSSGSDRWVPLSPDLARVLRKALVISRATDGAFDVTVGPEVQLWRRARRQRELPAPELLAAARAATGWTHLLIRSAGKGWEAKLIRPGMRLDLGGIAKGYALDEAAQTLRAHGVDRFLVSGGGDMVVGEAPPGAAGWRIEVGVFDTTNAPPPRFVSLRKASLATSGDVFQHVTIGEVRYSHIVDPRTGLGLTNHSLVTVVAADGMTADALSKPASILEPSRAMRILAEFRAEVLILRRPQERVEEWISPGFGKWWAKPAGPTKH